MTTIAEKIEMIDFLVNVKDIAYWEDIDFIYYGARSIINGHYRKEFDKLYNLRREYAFFGALTKQSDIDNILSLMKIAKRLNVKMPKMELDFDNVIATYDEIWEYIGGQVPMTPIMKFHIRKLANEILSREDELLEEFGEYKVDRLVDNSIAILEI